MENLKKEKEEIAKMKKKMEKEKQEMVYHMEHMRHEMVRAQQVRLIKKKPIYLNIDFNIISHLLHLHIFLLEIKIQEVPHLHCFFCQINMEHFRDTHFINVNCWLVRVSS